METATNFGFTNLLKSEENETIVLRLHKLPLRVALALPLL